MNSDPYHWVNGYTVPGVPPLHVVEETLVLLLERGQRAQVLGLHPHKYINFRTFVRFSRQIFGS